MQAIDDKKLDHIVQKAIKKFPPNATGGCFLATRWIIKNIPYVKEKVITVHYKNGALKHCIGILPDERIIDTQIFQLSLLLPIPQTYVYKGIFTKKEYEKLIGNKER